IYDADNTPEPNALTLLVENLMSDDKLGAVIGKFRTRNRNASLMTRFVNIETLAYQCMNQAGRWFFFKLCTIPGTNFVIRRSIIERIGGWDTKALSEDTE
ncbi:glycosyltransferase family 2 protein, partial [Ruminiclostridium cellobioparum]